MTTPASKHHISFRGTNSTAGPFYQTDPKPTARQLKAAESARRKELEQTPAGRQQLQQEREAEWERERREREAQRLREAWKAAPPEARAKTSPPPPSPAVRRLREGAVKKGILPPKRP